MVFGGSFNSVPHFHLLTTHVVKPDKKESCRCFLTQRFKIVPSFYSFHSSIHTRACNSFSGLSLGTRGAVKLYDASAV